MRVPEFLPDALWDRSRTYAAGGGHDDEHLPSWKHVEQADPRKDQRQPWDHKDLRIFDCAGISRTCTAVCRFSGDSDGGRPVFWCDTSLIIRHDAAVLQDLLEGRDLQYSIRLFHHGGNAPGSAL